MATGRPAGPLRRGWTTGACATGATRAALSALWGGEFPDPVEVVLPGGQRPAFALSRQESGVDYARAGIVKDAGDDPDVTHGLVVVSTVRAGAPGRGVTFRAGDGVGTATLPGLPVAVGEPAINPVPRQMMRDAAQEVAARYGRPADVEIEVSIPGGAEVAARTWNPRLGIVGGLSVLGTTGIVIPYSCSAWIASIHQGIDLARAAGHPHVAGCTGSTSERAVQRRYALPDTAMLDMGDFVGGLLTYLSRHPVPRLTIGGGLAKLSKLALGHLDLHSGRSQVSLDWLAERLQGLGATEDLVARARGANTALQVLELSREARLPLAAEVARAARDVARERLRDAPVAVDVVVVDREGAIVGESGA